MNKMTKNEWVIVNSLTYQIHTTENLKSMLEKLLTHLQLLIDFKSGNFYLSSEKDMYTLEEAATFNLDQTFAEDYIKFYKELDYSQGMMFTGKSLIYRESDLMPDKERVQTEYYKMFYQRKHFHHSLHLIIANNNHFLGVLSLFREKGKPDFQYDDIFILEMLKEHLEHRLYKNYEWKKNADNKLTIPQSTITFDLTRREETVLQLLVAGLNNEEICEKLYVTNNTLKKHILNLYRKMGIHNRIQIFQMVK